MQNNKIKKTMNLAFTFLLTGIVFLFINAAIGLLLIFAFIGIAGTLNVKYPDEMNEYRENLNKNAAAKNTMPETIKKYKIVHVDGINVADQNQKCTLRFDSNSISFIDSEDDILDELKFSDIKGVSILQEIEQKQKNKSAVTRAIVGGVLLGPVGAVVGGVSGLTPTIKENKKYFLEIKRPEPDDNILLTCSNKELKELKIKIAERL